MQTTAKGFIKDYYPGITLSEWRDWRWQVRNSISNIDILGNILNLNGDERDAVISQGGAFPLNITPYYTSLLDKDDLHQPLRHSVIPTTAEFIKGPYENTDPLGESAFSPVPCIVHRYPDRALFLVTNRCATHCRYCTRSRLIKTKGNASFKQVDWIDAITYIKGNKAIRDVLISGGDPLMLQDEEMEWLLSNLRGINHIEIIRIGTKAPVVLPQRITPHLARLLKRYHPLFMSIHIIHPDEITPEAVLACNRLADAGIPLGSQTVLLKGINDNLNTIRALMHSLIRVRIKPYYLFHCDPVSGSGHFRTSIDKGIQIVKGLRGYTTGYAVPVFAIDLPGDGGKIPLSPEYVYSREGSQLLVKNYQGKTFKYPDGEIN